MELTAAYKRNIHGLCEISLPDGEDYYRATLLRVPLASGFKRVFTWHSSFKLDANDDGNLWSPERNSARYKAQHGEALHDALFSDNATQRQEAEHVRLCTVADDLARAHNGLVYLPVLRAVEKLHANLPKQRVESADYRELLFVNESADGDVHYLRLNLDTDEVHAWGRFSTAIPTLTQETVVQRLFDALTGKVTP